MKFIVECELKGRPKTEEHLYEMLVTANSKSAALRVFKKEYNSESDFKVTAVKEVDANTVF